MSFYIVNGCTLLSLSYINDCEVLLHFLGSSLFYTINYGENVVKTSVFCDLHEICLYPLSGCRLGMITALVPGIFGSQNVISEVEKEVTETDLN